MGGFTSINGMYLLFYSILLCIAPKYQNMDLCKLFVFVGSRGLHEELWEKISQWSWEI